MGGNSGVGYLVLQVHYGKVDNFVGELSDKCSLQFIPGWEQKQRLSIFKILVKVHDVHCFIFVSLSGTLHILAAKLQ